MEASTAVLDLDERFMQMALAIAEAGRGQTSPNPLVGCVLVKDGAVVGQGAHLRAGGPHAEVHALAMAGAAAMGATAYVTLEPCSHHGRTPPCADALIAAGVRRVVAATLDPNPRVAGSGVAKLRAAGVQVDVGLLSAAASRQNEAFFTWVTRGRPFVVWKCAATLDGYVATDNGHSQYVTGSEARAQVQQLRQNLAAIAVGVGTVLADNPRLTVHGSEGKQPVRVIFDSHLRTPSAARLLAEPGETLIYCTEAASQADVARLSAQARVKCIQVAADGEGRVSVSAALIDLARRGLHSLLLEGGPHLAGAFVRARAVDKVRYYVAPKLLGGGRSALTGLLPAKMTDALALRDVEVVQVGADLCVRGYVEYPSEAAEEGGTDHVHRTG